MPTPHSLVAALLVALAVDRWWGEPRAHWHPVVWMGHFLGWSGAWVQRRTLQDPAQRDLKAFWLAALAWIVGGAMVFVVSLVLQNALVAVAHVLGPWLGGGLGIVLLGLLLKPLLALRMLCTEVLAVEAALAQSLDAGRERLRWLVSRDVAALTERQVRESAIESLAENLNDSVVAPIFWFLLLGLPGAALYRFANTADAMWGYKGFYKSRNWEWAGKWAALADDVLSWLPARLTALLLGIVTGGLPWKSLQREARRTPSPNSGWPMAGMALALGVSLSKPGVYVLNAPGRAPLAADTARALRLASNAVVALVFIAFLAIFFVVFPLVGRGVA